MTAQDNLALAVERQDLAMAQSALAQGANPAATDTHGRSPLLLALCNGAPEIFEPLLRACPPEAFNPAPDLHGMLPIDYVFGSINLLGLDALLRAGSNPNALNGQGLPAMQQAIKDLQHSNYQVADETMFYAAFALLMAHGADPEVKNAQGQTFAQFAIQEGRPGFAQLPAQFEDARAQEGLDGPAFATFILDQLRSPATAPRAPEPPPRNPLDQPLLDACKKGDVDEIGRLAGQGAYLEAHQPKEGSALILAIKSGSDQAVAKILALGADASGEFVGPQGPMRPLHVAASRGSPAMCQALVGSGAGLETLLADSFTPAMLSLMAERWDNLATLSKLGADLGARDAEGQSLPAMAREAGHGDIADWIALSAQARQSKAQPPRLPPKDPAPR